MISALPACSGGEPAQPGVQQTSPSSTTSPSQPEPAAGFTNPVFDSNFPDPMIFAGADQTYWSVATNGNGSNVQTLQSKDLTTWTPGPDALPSLPDWTTPGKVWAPEVAVQADDRFVMYYTTPGPDPTIQCISVAVAKKAEGPYEDKSTKPIVCETKAGGSIDASPFLASDGKRYLYWKNDGNAVGVDTWISVQELSADGLKLVGKPKQLMQQDLPWEGTLVEGPFVWEKDGTFHMFYSANSYASADYAVGHATSKSPLGPFKKSGDPILVTNDVAAGPGHCALFEKDGKVWMVYHAWAPDSIGPDFPGRTMWLSEVTFNPDGTVAVTPPTVDYPTTP